MALDLVQYRRGLTAYTTPKGIRVLVLRLGAATTDTPEWIFNEKRRYTQKQWRREMEGDWSSPAGEPYFPVFSELGGRAVYVLPMKKLIRGAVYRAYDTGRRRPACVWFQYSPKSDRVVLLREFMPHDLQTHEFRDAVRYLSRQCDFDELTERARFWVSEYSNRQSGGHCPPPWFPHGTRFFDIGGKEILQSSGNAFRKEEATVVDIFAAAGIFLNYVSPSVLGRNRVVERMMMMRPDGYPGMLIDPQCEEIISGFEGAFCYPEPTKSVPVPTKPKDDGHYINLLDALGYGIVAICPPDTPVPDAKEDILGYRGRDEIRVMRRADEEVIPWRENLPARLR